MFSGPPLPLPPELPLSQLLAHAGPPGMLGVWVRGHTRQLGLYRVSTAGPCRVLASPDLGFLIGRCARIAVREGARLLVLEAELVIQWRALQVATATPYLPGIERLRVLFPGLRSDASGLLVPVCEQSPEEVLARCVAEGMQVSGSRIVYTETAEGRHGNSLPSG